MSNNKIKKKETGFKKAGEFVLTHYPGKMKQANGVSDPVMHQEELYNLRKNRSLL